MLIIHYKRSAHTRIYPKMSRFIGAGSSGGLVTFRSLLETSGSTSASAIELNVWLLAGGGGGQGSNSLTAGAGGGAGGLVDSTFVVLSGKTYVITAGAGGGGGGNGNDSVFLEQGTENLVPTLTAYGGGSYPNGGGCGSGGGYAGVLNQGNKGGNAGGVYNGYSTSAGGGGVGAAAPDVVSATAVGPFGGLGTTAYDTLLSLVEEGVLYNGVRYVGTGGDASNNAGGAYTYNGRGTFSGGTNLFGAGSGGGCINRVVQVGGNAAAFSGSGGGGGYAPPGSGGSGFVIIYYPTTSPQITTTGNPSYYTDGTYHYYKYKSSGTATF